MVHWFNMRSALPVGSFYELKLEDLVASPETTLRDICRFAEVPFDRMMLQTDLSHSHSGRWKQEYNDYERIAVHKILSDIIEELGYDVAS